MGQLLTIVAGIAGRPADIIGHLVKLGLGAAEQRIQGIEIVLAASVQLAPDMRHRP